MDQLTDLKAILHSKRANIFYLEKCKVIQKDGRVLYLAETDNENRYWNIPIANTTVLLMGIGTSITQSAIRMLASAGVLVGFSGGGGTPLLMSNEAEWLTPQSEYRPTEYMQAWVKFWFKEEQRLRVAQEFQISRLKFLERVWSSDRDLNLEGFNFEDAELKLLKVVNFNLVKSAKNVGELLSIEASLTKQLYKYAASRTSSSNFLRNRESSDKANVLLNHGNYLAYGMAASVLWVLGISHSFAVMHGKTRRGALVFDVADLIKDSLILPWAFISAKENLSEQEFREQCLQSFTKHKALDFMYEVVKSNALLFREV